MRKFFALLLVLMTMFLFVGCGGGNTNENAGAKKIIVGLDDNYPPMGFKDEKNEIVGFDIDLAKEASKRLDKEVEFKAIDWSSKEAELKSGRIDVLWNGLDITEKRKENMLFSDPYMDNRQIIFTKNTTQNIHSVEDLTGKVVGTQSGSSAEEYFDNNPDVVKTFGELKKYSDYIAAFMDLENGRLDAIVADEITGRYYMSKHPNIFEALDVTVGPVSTFGIGFRKDDTELRNSVQKVLDEMKADGTMAQISTKWFDADITKKDNK